MPGRIDYIFKLQRELMRWFAKGGCKRIQLYQGLSLYLPLLQGLKSLEVYFNI